MLLTLVVSCDSFNSITGISDNDTIEGSRNILTQNAELSGFNKVNISHSFDVVITKGDSFSVVYSVDDNLLEHLMIYTAGNILYLGLESDYNYRNVTLQAEITCPDITDIELSGASKIELHDFAFAHDFLFELSGASNLQGDLECNNLYGDLSGASRVELTGRGNNINIESSGASSLRLGDFWGNDATLNLSGASMTYLNVVGTINADLSGASILYYYGSPTLGRLNISGGSNVLHL